jgi:hypothetical protein
MLKQPDDQPEPGYILCPDCDGSGEGTGLHAWCRTCNGSGVLPGKAGAEERDWEEVLRDRQDAQDFSA